MSKIPQIIHYCWFGGNDKPELILKCIASWKKYMPDCEIMEWNENNYDVHKAPFIEQAYEKKKWAYVSDFARFDILNRYGGIYFDTDVELLKPIPKEILEQSAFTGFESSGKVSPGLVYASYQDFKITKEIFDKYNNMNFIINGKIVYKTVNTITSEILAKYSELNPNEIQIIEGLAIYPSQYFCGYDLDIREYDIRPETISVHHYAGSWKNDSTKRKVQDKVKKYIGINNYRKLLNIKRKFLGISGENN